MAKPIFLAAVTEGAPLPGIQKKPSPYEKVTVGVNEVLVDAQLILMLKLVPFASSFVPLMPGTTKSLSVVVGTVKVLGTLNWQVEVEMVGKVGEDVTVAVTVSSKTILCNHPLTKGFPKKTELSTKGSLLLKLVKVPLTTVLEAVIVMSCSMVMAEGILFKPSVLRSTFQNDPNSVFLMKTKFCNPLAAGLCAVTVTPDTPRILTGVVRPVNNMMKNAALPVRHELYTHFNFPL